MDLHLPTMMDDTERSRAISNEQISELKRRLNALRKTVVSEAIALKGQHHASISSCPTKLLEFGNHQVQQVIDNAEHIFSISSVLKYVYYSLNEDYIISPLGNMFRDTRNDFIVV